MSRRTRVLHVLPDLQRGGGQVVVHRLVTAGDPERHEWSVAHLGTRKDFAAAFADEGVPVIALPSGRLAGMRAVVTLAALLRRQRVDIVHVHSDADRRVGQLAALLTGRPVVGHLHSPWAHLDRSHAADASAARRMVRRLRGAVRATVERRTVRHYVAAGAAVAEFHRPLLDAPITVATNGVDVSRFLPPTPERRAAARATLGLAPGCAVIVCVGRLAVGKGQDGLIDALEDVPEATLLLAGGGDQEPALRERAAAAGVADRVAFAGDLDDVRDALWAADVFAMASASEGLPLSVIEAMACGLPVVAYDLPSLREVVGEGREGRLVPWGDRAALAAHLRCALADVQTRAQWGESARRAAVRCFDARVTARITEGVYEAVLQTARTDVRRFRDRSHATA